MLWTTVKSSNIAAVAYMDKTLFIRFVDGTEYSYEGVPAGEYQKLLCASSVGAYFHSNIKKSFTAKKVEKK